MRAILVSVVAATLVSTASAEPVHPTHPDHRASKIVALIGVGLGLTSFALGAGPKLDEVSTGKSANDPTVIKRFDRDHDIAKYGGTGTFAAGCVALGIAGALFIHERYVYEHTLVAPLVAPGQFGIAASGSF